MKKNTLLALLLYAVISSFFYSPQHAWCQGSIDDFTILEKPDQFFYDKGSKAFIFQIDENFSLKNFQSTIISFKYHFPDGPRYSSWASFGEGYSSRWVGLGEHLSVSLIIHPQRNNTKLQLLQIK